MELGKKHLAVGVALILFVGLGFLATKVIGFDLFGGAEFGDANCSVQINVVGYKDGEPVTAPIFNSPFEVGGAAVDSLVITVSWLTAGVGIDWETFVFEGTIKVKQEIGTDLPVKFSSSWFSSEQFGNHTETLVMGQDICKGDDLQLLGGYGDFADYGWILHVYFSGSVSAVDMAGIDLYDQIAPLSGELTVMWVSSLQAAATWSWDY